MKSLAVIPARGGSKRIPKKNIRLFAGKPLISYAISAAIQSELFDEVVVTTDSEEIAEVAGDFGAKIPFRRPAELSDDFTPTFPVLKHAVKWFVDRGEKIDYFCCIYANPFITASNLKKAFRVLKEKNATSVVPVTTFPSPIFRSYKINEEDQLEFIFPEYSLTRSQDLSEAYHDVGQFYWWNCEKFLRTENIKQLQKDKRHYFVIPRHVAQDLDTPEDWDIAEKLYTIFVT